MVNQLTNYVDYADTENPVKTIVKTELPVFAQSNSRVIQIYNFQQHHFTDQTSLL